MSYILWIILFFIIVINAISLFIFLKDGIDELWDFDDTFVGHFNYIIENESLTLGRLFWLVVLLPTIIIQLFIIGVVYLSRIEIKLK